MPVKKFSDAKVIEVKAGTQTTMQILISSEEGPNFAMRRFEIQPGGGMPMDTNEVEHEHIVLGGRGRVHLGQEVYEVEKDDVLYIPAGLPHSYESIGEEPFAFICSVPNKPDKIEILG